MKIAIVGSGAMGMLYSGYLSESKNDTVYLVGRNQERMDLINNEGLIITEKGINPKKYNVKAVVDTTKLGEMDFVILLVKSTDTVTALDQHKSLIGENTILMTLQNGYGHEPILMKYAKEVNIAVGTTEDGSSITKGNEICHSGVGNTTFSMVNKDNKRLEELAKLFNEFGFKTATSDNIKRTIWHKLIINASTSALSGLLQMPQGFCLENEFAWDITKQLIQEIIDVAKADGVEFCYEEQITRMEKHLIDGRNGLVSLYADLRDGRLTEVDTISGTVISFGKKLGVATPTHNLIVSLIHASEGKKDF